MVLKTRPVKEKDDVISSRHVLPFYVPCPLRIFFFFCIWLLNLNETCGFSVSAFAASVLFHFCILLFSSISVFLFCDSLFLTGLSAVLSFTLSHLFLVFSFCRPLSLLSRTLIFVCCQANRSTAVSLSLAPSLPRSEVWKKNIGGWLIRCFVMRMCAFCVCVCQCKW